MRVPVQRYLILWLCLGFSSSASASPAITENYYQCRGAGVDVDEYPTMPEFWASKNGEPGFIIDQTGPNLNAPYPEGNCASGNITACPTGETWTGLYNSLGRPACRSPEQLEQEGYCPEGTSIDIHTAECVQDAQQPEECSEVGELYDPTTQQCVTECEHGMFNGSCLLPPEEDPECSKDSPDYRGEVVLGYGTSPIPACGDFDQCSGDTPGQVGFVNGELRCIPEDYGIPSCQGDSITVIDEYGFVCEPLSNAPVEPETPEEPNTDTDGDGTPDEYQRENDPESVDKGLDKVQDGISDTNTKLDGTNKRLDKVGKALEGVNDNLKDGLGTANQTLNSINDTLDNAFNAPEGGFSSEGLNVIPTLTETATGFKQAIMGNELIQAVGGLAEIPSQTSCPVWTVPSTPISDARTITIHCDILEDNRGVFSLLFMFFWTGVALFAFLRA